MLIGYLYYEEFNLVLCLKCKVWGRNFLVGFIKYDESLLWCYDWDSVLVEFFIYYLLKLLICNLCCGY